MLKSTNCILHKRIQRPKIISDSVAYINVKICTLKCQKCTKNTVMYAHLVAFKSLALVNPVRRQR